MALFINSKCYLIYYREGISLRELQAPPSRPKGREQRVPIVVNACMEQPIKGHETEPFLP